MNEVSPINVYVHLAFGYGPNSWTAKYDKDLMVGTNERFAYGYHHANSMGCIVTYSQDYAENAFQRLFRLGLRFMLEFDLIHAWRNREKLTNSDVVWTHTESQSLGILALRRLLRLNNGTKYICQNVWLIDRWKKYNFLKRNVFAYLLSSADILTFHSNENLQIARRLFPRTRCELVLFGIKVDNKKQPKRREISNPARVLSIGNDEHRDWDTLIGAIRAIKNAELRIISQNRRVYKYHNPLGIFVSSPKTNSELLSYFDWADLVVVPLKKNWHASGITVIQEAILHGLPVLCSDTGGLRCYFDDSDVWYVEAEKVVSLADRIREAISNKDERSKRTISAQSKMGKDGISSISFVRRHVELTRELIFRDWSAARFDRTRSLGTSPRSEPEPHPTS
jgi:glycosyltransferase involved in cell wall biosynthesis